MLLELTVIRASWTFGLDYSEFLLAGVIWMLGWCMILLAGLVWLPTRAIGIIGLVVIVFQGMFEPLGQALPVAVHQVWEFIYPIGAEVRIGQTGPSVAVLYSLVPWVGVMAAGYAFGAIMVREPAERRRLCLRIGLSATAPLRGGGRTRRACSRPRHPMRRRRSFASSTSRSIQPRRSSC